MEHLQSVQNIFKDQLFTVPDYQRGYAWELQQWQDLWDDLDLLETEQEHYAGTLVLNARLENLISDDYGDNYRPYDIVDGQQRLTTLSILINEMIRQLESLGEITQANAMRIRYVATAKNGAPLPKLQLNRDTNEFYKKSIIASAKDISEIPQIMSEKRLAEAQQFFRGCFEKQKELLDEGYLGWLSGMRTKIISQIKLTVYLVPKASDVGVIFEVMNNRGKTLTDMEKVKNYLLYVCTKLAGGGGEDLAQEINEAWKYIYETIMRYDGAGLREDALLRFNWIVTQNYQPKEWKGSNSVKEKFSLKSYKIRYGEGWSEKLRDDIRRYIELLRQSCRAFCDIHSPEKDGAFEDFGNENLRKRIVEYSHKLVRLNTTAIFTPMLIASRLNKNSTPEEYLNLLMLCEKYAFRVFRMMRRRADAGQSAFYQTSFDYFSNEIGSQVVYDTVHEWLTHFCSQEEFEEAVDEVDDWYNWYGLKYLFFEYESYLAGKALVHLDWTTFQRKDKKDTIEHILPQTPNKPYWKQHWPKKKIRDEVTHDIGNLVVTLDNSSYGNKGFDEKKGSPGSGVCYANSCLFSEKELCVYDDWNYETYSQRREKLANWMKERWHIEDYVGDQDIDGIDEAADEEIEIQ